MLTCVLCHFLHFVQTIWLLLIAYCIYKLFSCDVRRVESEAPKRHTNRAGKCTLIELTLCAWKKNEEINEKIGETITHKHTYRNKQTNKWLKKLNESSNSRKMPSIENINKIVWNMFNQMLSCIIFTWLTCSSGCLPSLRRFTCILHHKQYWRHSLEMLHRGVLSFCLFLFSYCSAHLNVVVVVVFVHSFHLFCIRCAYSSKMLEYLNEWKNNRVLHTIHLLFFTWLNRNNRHFDHSTEMLNSFQVFCSPLMFGKLARNKNGEHLWLLSILYCSEINPSRAGNILLISDKLQMTTALLSVNVLICIYLKFVVNRWNEMWFRFWFILNLKNLNSKY